MDETQAVFVDSSKGRGAAYSALAGGIAGLVWGGVGGRVAMRIVFLTSDDRVRGVISDDGFEIGRISFETIELLVFATFLGVIGGLTYGFVRMLLRGPTWVVAMAVGVAVGSGVGALIVQPGVDFELLEPLWLTIGLFVLLPGAWGVTVVLLTERLLRNATVPATAPSQVPTRRRGAMGRVVAWLLWPPFMRRWGTRGSVVAWLLLAAITVAGVIDIARDVARLT